MLFKEIRKTQHYIIHHSDEVPWSEVVAVIFASAKSMRRKGSKIEIENSKYYMLCEIKDQILWVINAKRK